MKTLVAVTSLAVLLAVVCACGCGSASPPPPVAPGPVPTFTNTAAVTRTGGTRHLEYVFNDGPVSVYDIDHGFKLVESFRLPGTSHGVRGVAVSPRTHKMFVSYGGDGGANGNGAVLAFDLVRKAIVWSVNLKTGIDSAAVSTDGRLLYMPDGELSSDGNWYIISTRNGHRTCALSTTAGSEVKARGMTA